LLESESERVAAHLGGVMVPISCLCLLAFVLGCDGEPDEGDLVAEVSTDECLSGRKWIGGDEESARMHPGGDCIGCHEREGEGPRYLVAGTVYESVAELDDCFGLAAALVEITDAEGREWSLRTNDAGNFFIEDHDGPLALPYTAKVVFDGMELAMATPQSDGACATCHTENGANQAAGRIFVP
jgi:cytochrome c553